jgi:hypothetical protein
MKVATVQKAGSKAASEHMMPCKQQPCKLLPTSSIRMQRPLAKPSCQVLHPVLSRQAKPNKTASKQKDSACYCLVHSFTPQKAIFHAQNNKLPNLLHPTND